MRDFLRYAEFEGLWERFSPRTPFGRQAKEAMTVHTRAQDLEALWDGTEALLGWLDATEAVRVDLARHHLSRLPRFPEEALPVYDEVELFQFKKFITNTRALHALLPPDLCARFGLGAVPEILASRLDLGRQGAETFHLEDAYSPELAQARREIREADEALRRARDARAEEIRTRWGLDFGFRDFLLVARDRLGDPQESAGWLQVEPYDGTRSAVRPLPGARELALAERRASLAARERACEDDVLAELSALARQALPELLACRDAVEAFDLALARAELARRLGLVRPVLGPGPLSVRGGRFLPCEEACRRLGVAYTPLDADLDSPVTVLFGSNMGGKTVVLKTLAFLQLCVQTGLFAPAAAFHTRVFEAFHYVGEGCDREGSQGLSGFGFEIRQLDRAWADRDRSVLALFDEFARTTSSVEAEALLTALFGALSEHGGVVALFGTHFKGVRRLPGVRHLRMRGLDRAGLDLRLGPHAPLEERIRLIDQHMDYRLEPEADPPRGSDALAVAALLGLDPGVAARARELLGET